MRMSRKIPVLKPQEIVNILVSFGSIKVRQKSSHQQFRHGDGRGKTVPFHKGSDISPSLLRKIASDIGLTIDEFLEDE